MLNSSLRVKVIAICLILSCLQLITGAVGYFGLERVAKTFSRITDESLPNIQLIAEMRDRSVRSRVIMADLGLSSLDAKEFKEEQELLRERLKEYAQFDKEYNDIPFLPGEQELYDAQNLKWKELSGWADKALKMSFFANEVERQQWSDSYEKIIRKAALEHGKQFEKLIEFHRTHANGWIKDAHSLQNSVTWIMVFSIALSLLASIVLGQIFSSWLSRTLSGIARSLSSGAENVTTASLQISNSSELLSQSSTEQAAALQETAASAEEMSAMVSKNAENAKKSSDLSQQSQESAGRGKEIVAELTHAIGEIDTSNQGIRKQTEESNQQVEEIVKLINDIADKTRVINDIVFQTKLLSFNASVEAARAGEHGKGFAVVAEEVGNLAAMSGKAAQEIGTMVTASIQKVQTIVQESKAGLEKMLSTSQEKVQRGSEIAERCAQVLDDLVRDVASVSHMSSEIASASAEQANGVREINQAIGQLDQVTQQNATVARETSAAVQDLQQQAHGLRGNVSELMSAVDGGDAGSSETGDRHSHAKPSTSAHPKRKTAASKTHAARDDAKTAKILTLPRRETRSPDGSFGAEKKPITTAASAPTTSLGIPAEDDPRFKEL